MTLIEFVNNIPISYKLCRREKKKNDVFQLITRAGFLWNKWKRSNDILFHSTDVLYCIFMSYSGDDFVWSASNYLISYVLRS